MEDQKQQKERITRLPRIKTRRQLTARDCGEDEHQEAESVLPVHSGTLSCVIHVQLYLTLVLLGFVTVVYSFVFAYVCGWITLSLVVSCQNSCFMHNNISNCKQVLIATDYCLEHWGSKYLVLLRSIWTGSPNTSKW